MNSPDKELSECSPIHEKRMEIENDLQKIKENLANLVCEFSRLSVLQKICYGWLVCFPVQLFWKIWIKKYERLLENIILAESDLKHSQIKVRWASSSLSENPSNSEDPEKRRMIEHLDSLDRKIEAILRETSENNSADQKKV